jgi:hypothetical protein
MRTLDLACVARTRPLLTCLGRVPVPVPSPSFARTLLRLPRCEIWSSPRLRSDPCTTFRYPLAENRRTGDWDAAAAPNHNTCLASTNRLPRLTSSWTKSILRYIESYVDANLAWWTRAGDQYVRFFGQDLHLWWIIRKVECWNSYSNPQVQGIGLTLRNEGRWFLKDDGRIRWIQHGARTNHYL